MDNEFPSSISTRKLVIETAKFNVITAYSSQEAIATLQLFPAVDGAVLDTGMPQMSCSELVARLKQIKPGLPIVVVGSPGAPACNGADFHLESFDPAKLLSTLQSLRPQETKQIAQRNEELDLQQRALPRE